MSEGFNVLVSTRTGPLLVNRFDKWLGRCVRETGEFSWLEQEMLRQVTPVGGVVVEVGANMGAHTVPLAQHLGVNGIVIAFEPQLHMHQLLCANVALNSLPNVLCERMAVGAEPGRIRVPVLKPDQDDTSFGSLSLDPATERGLDTAVVTIDGLNLSRLDLLKVDVEGMELEVFRGARHTMTRCRPVIYLENDRPQNSEALLDFLLSCGYRLYWHTPPLVQAEQNHFNNADPFCKHILSINVIGFPPGSDIEAEGFVQITSATDRPPNGIRW